MSKQLELNRLAIWQPKSLDEMTIRVSPAGRKFVKNDVVQITQNDSYRYAKNFGKGDKKFCLFIVCPKKQDEVKMEKWLNKQAKSIDEAIIQRVLLTSSETEFEYLDVYKEEK
ncbi:hypothetical protein [Sharpea azabuensis]